MKRFKRTGADSIVHGPSKKRTDESGVRPVDPASPPGGPNIASPGMEGRFHHLHISADDPSRRGFGPRGTPRWQRHPPHPHDGRPVVHFHARALDEVAEYGLSGRARDRRGGEGPYLPGLPRGRPPHAGDPSREARGEQLVGRPTTRTAEAATGPGERTSNRPPRAGPGRDVRPRV